MERKKYTDPILLFPNYFKKVGIVAMISTVAFIIVMKYLYVNPTQYQKDVFKTIASSLFMLGLFLIVLAKEKQEDERTYAIRLQAMSRAFTFIVFYALIDPFGSLIFEDMPSHSIQSYIILMLIIYLLSYYSRKTSI